MCLDSFLMQCVCVCVYIFCAMLNHHTHITANLYPTSLNRFKFFIDINNSLNRCS